MRALYWRDEILRATKTSNATRIDQLAAQLARAEESQRLLQVLTHCPACADSAARSAPDANDGDCK